MSRTRNTPPLHVLIGKILLPKVAKFEDEVLPEIFTEIEKLEGKIEATQAKITEAVAQKKRGKAAGLQKRLQGQRTTLGVLRKKRLPGAQRTLERAYTELEELLPKAEAERDRCTSIGKTIWACDWQDRIDQIRERLLAREIGAVLEDCLVVEGERTNAA